MIKAIETAYNGYRFRSRLETRWAKRMRIENVIPALAFLATSLDVCGIDGYSAVLIFTTIAAIVGLVAGILGARKMVREEAIAARQARFEHGENGQGK